FLQLFSKNLQFWLFEASAQSFLLSRVNKSGSFGGLKGLLTARRGSEIGSSSIYRALLNSNRPFL
ncbi:MAG: hypothetical protein IJS20_08695, partial [Bacteroidales bacterium]|nr:hypothetical protein [Bacteroidales bacterium]